MIFQANRRGGRHFFEEQDQECRQKFDDGGGGEELHYSAWVKQQRPAPQQGLKVILGLWNFGSLKLQKLTCKGPKILRASSIGNLAIMVSLSLFRLPSRACISSSCRCVVCVCVCVCTGSKWKTRFCKKWWAICVLFVRLWRLSTTVANSNFARVHAAAGVAVALQVLLNCKLVIMWLKIDKR